MGISPTLSPPPERAEPLAGRILVVDDNPQSAQVLASLLSSEGFSVQLAHSGPQALKTLEAGSFDLMLLDVMMPGMDGFEVLAAVRAGETVPDLPVILVTALDASQDVVRGLELGANDYLPKPPQFEVLLARVHTQLKLKRLQDLRTQHIKSLEELSRLKDRFMQIAAHDFKNPLNNISVGLELLQRYEQIVDTPAEFAQIVDVMRGAHQTMNMLVSDFLDVQAAQHGHMELAKVPLDLVALAEKTAGQFQVAAQEKNISLIVSCPAQVPPVPADPDRIGQVASNLISNAIKFSPAGASVTVRVEAHPGFVRFTVEDTGPGILEAELQGLFIPFARLSNRPTGKESSTGLGLAITKEMVDLHQGRIGVHSVRGEGSTFWFDLYTNP